ncbi:MAG TPA: LapA family protein [Acidimicrobiales bacterium]|nr:LapA family protein [Acidimicrobiales bacterium]
MTDATPRPGADEMAQLAVRRRRRIAKGLLYLVVVVLVAVFVAQNAGGVKVHFWFVTGRPRLIWVVLVSLVVGIVFGYVLGSPGRRKRRQRRRAQAGRRRRGHAEHEADDLPH